MITMGMRAAKDAFSEVGETAQHEQVVIMRHGRPFLLLRGIEGMDLDAVYLLTHPELQEKLAQARQPGRHKVSQEEAKRRFGIR